MIEIVEIFDALDRTEDPGERRGLVEQALAARDELVAQRMRTRARRARQLAEVHAGLARLRRVATSADLLDQVCAEAVRSCGVARVLLSRVEGTTWYPWMGHFKADPEGTEEFVAHMRTTTIDLTRAPIERAVLEEGRPRIVHNVDGPRSYGPIIAASNSTSYVVVPITPAGRVVGFLHADHHPLPRAVDEIDRDILWVFAEGFGRIYERTELLERLREQRTMVREAIEAVEAIVAAVDHTEIGLGDSVAARLPTEDRASLTSRVSELTERENEVLALMVRGLTNEGIALELAIARGTVKSHVKNILRKLGAANRTEAIGRVLAPPSGDS